MYTEQGYRGNLGYWKYAVLPLGFLGVVTLNYIATLISPISTEETLQQLIAQWGANMVLLSLLIPMALGLFIVWGWTYVVHQQSITSLTTARKKVDVYRIFFAFTVWGGITALLTAIEIYLSPDDYVFTFEAAQFIPLAIIAILFIPLQTSFEEYLFRGHMMQGLGIIAQNRWVPLVVTSVLFGLVHLANPEVEKLGYGLMVYYIGTGFFLGIVTLMDDGLELALGFHAANNLVTALLVTANWTALQTPSLYKDISEPVLGWEVFIPIFVVLPLVLLLFAKKYGWTHWKEKLTGKVLSKAVFIQRTHDTANRV